jgi:hypothetical protein
MLHYYRLSDTVLYIYIIFGIRRFSLIFKFLCRYQWIWWWIRWMLCSPSASSIEEGWLRMIHALTIVGNLKLCVLSERLFFIFYDVYVDEVHMSDFCFCIDYFRTSRSIGLSIPFSNFLFYWFWFVWDWYFVQEICHILEVNIFILLFMSWYERVVMDVDDVKMITSFASMSTFSSRWWCYRFDKLSY